MTSDELRALQAPLKDTYRQRPEAAQTPVEAVGHLGDDLTCRVETEASGGQVVAGLHPATGGGGTHACSGDLLLQALVGCAGVTLRAVATATGINVRGGTIRATGAFDARGTLGVDRTAPVGLQDVALRVSLDTDASESTLAKLLELTERYCVVLQTLTAETPVASTIESTTAVQ